MNKKLENVQWGEYRLGDLFEKVKVNRLKYKTSELPNKPNKKYRLPALTAGIQNQGLNNYVPLDNATVLKRAITISANGANTGATFYQKSDFTVLQDAYAIDIKKGLKYCLTDNQYIFIVSAISKSIYGNFEWTNKAGWEKVKDEYIQLPIKNGEIDFEFMESFVAELEAQRVAELEAQRVAELEAYLLATGLKDYELTDKEKQAVEDYENGRINLIELKVSDIFNVSSSKKRFDANKVDILTKGYPYVVRTSNNNGIKGYLNEDINYLNKGNTISFGQDTATMFYQENPYFTGDKIKILKSKFKNFNKYSAQYFIGTMSKSFSSFSWGASSFSEKAINKQGIFVKVKDNEIDFEYIETLISAIQKLVIRDVVIFADRRIEATKQVIDR
ncbi:restriction endonuclease subunit S [Clostridium perfringens]|nr:restriction endonuclease subunit S [Clostridium perfringens]